MAIQDESKIKELIDILKEYVDVYREHNKKTTKETLADTIYNEHLKIMNHVVVPVGKELLKIDKQMRILALEDTNYVLIEVKVKVLEEEEVMKKHGKILLRKLYISTTTQGFLISVYSDSTVLVSDIEKIYNRLSVTHPETVNLMLCSK
nr:MAG TPA: hypothetical protein [Caudoviricetes sp.]